MADRPILFSAPMIRALLDGRKTQTRRLVRFPQWAAGCFTDPFKIEVETGDDEGRDPSVICEETGCLALLPLPFAIGDRLWVREAWRTGYVAEGYREDLGRVARPSDFDPATTAIEYLADGTEELAGKKRPGIHMPRWASRLTLHVTDVRVQRLQDISEADAIAEGMHEPSLRDLGGDLGQAAWSERQVFARLWERLHGAGAWAANPWVSATTFEVFKGNIDALPSPAPEREMADA